MPNLNIPSKKDVNFPQIFNREQVVMRGYTAQIAKSPQSIHEGLAGKVFTSGKTYISHEFASGPMTREVSRSQIPFGWGGACLPIRTTTQILGGDDGLCAKRTGT